MKRLEMILIGIVGVRIHLLRSHPHKILHLHQYANVNPQIYSNPKTLIP